ncbi:MAG: DUF1232 domain-containing protein [Actinomycetota bacterium]|nr:DUF1232 domain-containing protein [Actinomycetota bacterium]
MTDGASAEAPQSVALAGVPDAGVDGDVATEAGGSSRWRELVRFLPDVARLLVDLTRDQRVPLRAKLVASLLAVYLFNPLDLVPDVLPGAGQVDDLALALVALRHLCRSAGYDVLHDLWRGSDDGFVALVLVSGVEK